MKMANLVGVKIILIQLLQASLPHQFPGPKLAFKVRTGSCNLDSNCEGFTSLALLRNECKKAKKALFLSLEYYVGTCN